MKRLLACTGFLYLVLQLALTFLPSAVFLPLAAFFIAAIIPAAAYRGKYRQHVMLLCIVPAAALIFRSAFVSGYMIPVRMHAGHTAEIHASVLKTSSGYDEDTVRAVALADQVNGKHVVPFKIEFNALPYVETGSNFTADVTFALPEKGKYTLADFADGIFLSGISAENFKPEANTHGLRYFIFRLRSDLVSGLRRILPESYAQISAAMTLGDRTFLTKETINLFRRAGVSHILVVSGLHLSAVSGIVYRLFRKFSSRKFSCCAAVAAVILFAVLAGSTPSVVRAGIAMTMLYAGGLFNRKSDSFTSLGFAALVLCMANPYASADIGLLLSFTATCGVLFVSEAYRKWKKETTDSSLGRFKKFMYKIGWMAAVPAATALTTLPVLISIHAGVSLLSVFSNILIVPLMPACVVLGFITAFGTCIPLLDAFAHLTGLLLALLLRTVVTISSYIGSVPYSYINFSGTFAVCISVLLLVFLWLAWKMKISFFMTLLSSASFLLISAVLYMSADADTIHVRLAGNNANPAVVVMQGTKTAVLFRGSKSNMARVLEVMDEYNRNCVDVVVDLRTEGDIRNLQETLSAKQIVSAENDIFNHKILEPFNGLKLYVKHQAYGNFVCAESKRYRLGVSAGRTEFTGYPPLDIYIAGSGTPEDLHCRHLVLPKSNYRWLNQSVHCSQQHGFSEIDIRTGRLIRIKEVGYDFK